MYPTVRIEIEKKVQQNNNDQDIAALNDPSNEANPHFKSDIQKANIFSKIHFGHVFKTVKAALRRDKADESLQDSDLFTFPYEERAEVLGKKFYDDMKEQKKRQPNKKPNLTLSIFKNTKWTMLKCITLALIFSFVRIFSAWVMKKMIDGFSISHSEAYKWAGAMTPCLVVGFYLEHHYNHVATYFPSHIRGALVSMIYDKVTKLSMYTITKISPGQIVNLAANDVNVFDETGAFFPKSLVAPFVVVACGALLWIYFGVICLIGVGYIALWYPLQGLYIASSVKSNQEKNKLTDERVKLTGETIEGIRLLKMYTWELRFKDRITELREKETKIVKGGLIAQGMWRAVSYSSLAVATFLIYMPYALTGGELTAGKVFSAFYIMAFMRVYGSYFVSLGLRFTIQARSVIHRVENLMEAPEASDAVFEEPKDEKNSIEFENYSAYWTKKDEKEQGTVKLNIGGEPEVAAFEPKPNLKDINLVIKKNSLNALIGAVGAGKTSFLMSFTGEMPKTVGSLRYKGKFAYVEQEPTIFAGTFRENILFGKPYDPEYYKKVIKACNLETDLKLFPKGDFAEIGEKGNNLSGGQKARLALARATYSNADIFLLDDPLSAVDSKVAKSIYENCFTGLLKGKTVILVTHQVDFVKSCENIIVMQEGNVLGSGSYNQLKERGVDTDKIFGNANSCSDNADNDDPDNKDDKPVLPVVEIKKEESHVSHVTEQGHDDHQHHDTQHDTKHNEKTEIKAKPRSKVDAVTLKTYYHLFRGMGNWAYLLIICLFFTASEMANIAYGRILGAWLAGTYPQWKCLAILGGLVGFTIFIIFSKYLLVNLGLSRTSKKHHKRMLEKVIHAPVLFFDTNAVGQILNRFSNDVGTLDRFLSLITMDVLDNAFFIGSMVITVGILDPILLGPLAGVFVVICITLRVCYPAVKETKAYDLTTRSTLFSLFSASLSGIVIIRSFHQANSFKAKFTRQLHTSLKGTVAFVSCARFLGFYVDMGYNLACIGCLYIITARSNPEESAGLAAFSLVLILSISGVLQYTLRQACQANILMAAAARIQSYWKAASEAPVKQPKDEGLKRQGWPKKADIDFNKVYMKYAPNAPHVIKNLTLQAESGQKIGCVGRTGAGKSSIIQLLFRLQEIDRQTEKEGYIKINEVDTQTVGLHLTRGNISIIPQIPFILTGTVRYNVDPLGKASDEEIWRVLEDVRLKEHVQNLPQQLDTRMTAATSVFSVGQKQLVCLARSILKPSNIMVMDEATANMDQETDIYVTNKIMERFAGSTTFTIAHRLSTIASYDRVLVLDKGQIKEFDEPYKLLVKNIGDDTITNHEGLFTSMVHNTGPTTSKYIFGLTKAAYERRHKNN